MGEFLQIAQKFRLVIHSFIMAPLLLDIHVDLSDDVFSSEHFALPLKRELESAVRVPRRRGTAIVRFRDLSSPEVINPRPEYYDDSDVEIKWFVPQELQQIRHGAKVQSTELRRSDQNQDCYLCLAHRKTSLMLKSDFKNLIKLTPSTPDQDLTKWCAHDDGRRGLERFASRDYNVLRRNDITNTRSSVLNEQYIQREQGAACQEKIAKAAREASRRARTFARFIAVADANEAKRAAQQEQERKAPPRTCSTVQMVVPARRLPSRCQSELRPVSRCAPPRKKSKAFHQIDMKSGMVNTAL
jgi:hypothetical protein